MRKGVEHYLSLGFDRRMAEYFSLGRRKIISVKPHEDFTLILSFDNGEIRRYDCKPFLK